MTVLLSLDVSTHVTKSSICLVTKNAGSVTASGPTLTCPCSTNFAAALTVSVGEHEANWTQIGISQVQDTVDLFAAYLNHTDIEEPLEYTVFPGVDLETFQWKSRTRRVETVRNDGDVSAVWDEEHGVFAAVFWCEEGGEIGNGRHKMEVDGNVAIVVDTREWTLTGTISSSVCLCGAY